MKRLALSSGFALALALCLPARAQSNAIPGTDVRLGSLGNLAALGRQGAFPNGTNGVAMATTSCNVGTVDVPWLAAMQEDHPVIAFLIARESNGRLVQISNRSNVKHGFFALSNSQCTTCQNPSNGTFLGVGCSDTYTTSTNGNNFNLGPADEIDPWLGTWTAQCSYFDMGDPAVPPPLDCDSIRSLTQSQAQALGPVGNRNHVSDQDLLVPGTFWYQAQYVIRGEPTANRANNLGSRGFVPTWTGNFWNLTETGALLQGSVLQRWSGGTAASASNGLDDGTVWVGVRAKQDTPGIWHYEYAVHNVDSYRAFDELAIPITVQASNFGFRDLDSDPTNDWTAQQKNGMVVFSTSSNPVLWNTIYNFWFDAPADPAAATVTVDHFLAGPGASSLAVALLAPVDDPGVYCSASPSNAGCLAAITPQGGSPVSGAYDYVVAAVGVESQKSGLLFAGTGGPASIPFAGGTLCVQPPLKRGPLGFSNGSATPACDGSLVAFVNDGNLLPDGLDAGPGNSAWYQWWYRDPSAPPGQTVALSDALRLDFQ